MASVEGMRDESGKFMDHVWPGGYPVYYVDGENSTVCPKCANETGEDFGGIVACDVNYEDAHLYCGGCSTRIPSAYAEDEHA